MRIIPSVDCWPPTPSTVCMTLETRVLCSPIMWCMILFPLWLTLPHHYLHLRLLVSAVLDYWQDVPILVYFILHVIIMQLLTLILSFLMIQFSNASFFLNVQGLVLMLTTLNVVMWGSVWEHLRIALVMSSVTLLEIAVMTSTAHVIEVSA